MPDSSYSSFPSMPSYEPSGSNGETPAERVLMEVSRRHSDFLNMASSAHTAYLNTVSQVMGGAPAYQAGPARALPNPAPAQPPAISPAARPSEPVVADAPAAKGTTPARPSAPAVGKPAQTRQTPSASSSPTMAPAPANPIAENPAPARKPSSMDAIALVRGIIADKTGYPEDMLDPDMDLEGELGVDSIKQVEILSTIREQLPELPEIDPERLVELRTIAAIAEMVSGSSN